MSLFRLLTDFDGRIGPVRFWIGSAIVALALLAIQQGTARLPDRYLAGQIVAFANAFALFPWAALAAKRATDRGGSTVFGILLVCAIVLPTHLRPFLGIGWEPSLQTVSLIAWVVAFIDLGIMPSAHEATRVAERAPDAKAGAWTPFAPPPSPSTRSTLSR